MKIFIASCIILFSIIIKAQDTTDFISPKPTGSWDVGRILLELVDSSRTDITNSTDNRTIPTWIWYPTQKENTITPQFALNREWKKEQTKYLSKKIGIEASLFLRDLKVWATANASVAPVNERFPILIFGPGYSWLPTDFSAIIEEVVSHGYIVIGYTPTGFPGVTQLANGQIATNSLSINQQDVMFDDAMFVRRNLYKLENSPIKNIADIKKVGIFGHSLGGVAATFLAASDTSIKAIVNLDGDLMGTALKVKVSQPALLLSNDERIGIEQATEKMDREGRERSEYRRHSDWVRVTDNTDVALRIRITGIRHLNFCDLGLININKLIYNERKNKLGDLDGSKYLKIIAKLTVKFFDAYLKNDNFFTLVELEESYPEVQALLWKGLPYHE